MLKTLIHQQFLAFSPRHLPSQRPSLHLKQQPPSLTHQQSTQTLKNQKPKSAEKHSQTSPQTRKPISNSSAATLQIRQPRQRQKQPNLTLQSINRHSNPAPKIPQNPQIIEHHRQKEVQPPQLIPL